MTDKKIVSIAPGAKNGYDLTPEQTRMLNALDQTRQRVLEGRLLSVAIAGYMADDRYMIRWAGYRDAMAACVGSVAKLMHDMCAECAEDDTQNGPRPVK
ncbi:hypothetical protein [Blastochloris tepida]|uniref:Uncharacterized protein n=1 Tax=Blastochloris tepida TaxID=2233851 RepID=A0A348FZB6_9HYPH|nr:hypothetical protein [Blastochloris tepida]BBF92649.1 hypothetical protein BLTE_13340 [Blastochloris tepida]